MGLGYRSSLLLNFPHWLVAEAEFILTTPAPPETIKQRLRDLQAARRARQPANYRNCGSVFKNPAGTPGAGFLIEAAGLKGRRVGEAQVSRKHANFILNQGRATAAQVKALIARSRNRSGAPRGWPWSGKCSFCRMICGEQLVRGPEAKVRARRLRHRSEIFQGYESE